ncbi:hypothetical protein ACLOJK_041071 [Asimina triloba]
MPCSSLPSPEFAGDAAGFWCQSEETMEVEAAAAALGSPMKMAAGCCSVGMGAADRCSDGRKMMPPSSISAIAANIAADRKLGFLGLLPDLSVLAVDLRCWWSDLKGTMEDVVADDGGATRVGLQSRRIRCRPVVVDLLDGLDPPSRASPVMVSSAVRCG